MGVISVFSSPTSTFVDFNDIVQNRFVPQWKLRIILVGFGADFFCRKRRISYLHTVFTLNFGERGCLSIELFPGQQEIGSSP